VVIDGRVAKLEDGAFFKSTVLHGERRSRANSSPVRTEQREQRPIAAVAPI